MPDRVLPDDTIAGAFHVRFGPTSQSWVDPERPDFLAFEYVQHIAMLLDHTVLGVPSEQRLRIVHIGGAGMSVPRWVAWRRPGTAQIVCEPDRELTEEVRRKIPLPARSGIKVRDVDGRVGVTAMPESYADVVILDAFAGARVPAELVTGEFLDDVARVGRGARVFIANVTDVAPFHWSKRLAAGVAERWRHVVVGAEVAVHKGKRFGNLLVAGTASAPDVAGIRRESAALPYGYRWLASREAMQWIGGATAWSDADTRPSPEPPGGKMWFG